MKTYWAIIFLSFILHVSAISSSLSLSYSFPVPEEFGKLTYKDGGCCELMKYPVNNTSSEKSKYPSFVGIGVMKTGTSTLYYHMLLHPDFVGSYLKEVHFLDFDNDTLTVFDYLNNWNSTKNPNNVNTLEYYEITPTYLWVPISACRAQYVYPNMKFVVILRDQVSRSYSHFSFDQYWCNENASSPDDCGYVSDYYESMSYGIKQMKDMGCDFNSGHPVKSWNDCYKCMAWFGFGQHKCGSNVFFKKHEDRDQDECIDFGEIIVSMNMYSAQVAWWFHFFKPDQFYFINSDSFELATTPHFQYIVDFIGHKNPYLSKYNEDRKLKQNKGIYKEPTSKENMANQLLLEFLDRPNRELIQLLHSTGHTYFNQFKIFEEYNNQYEQQNFNIYKSIANFFNINADTWNYFTFAIIMFLIFSFLCLHGNDLLNLFNERLQANKIYKEF